MDDLKKIAELGDLGAPGSGELHVMAASVFRSDLHPGLRGRLALIKTVRKLRRMRRTYVVVVPLTEKEYSALGGSFGLKRPERRVDTGGYM